MSATRTPRPVYDAKKVAEDMGAAGVDVMEMAERTELSHMTIRRFLAGKAQTPKTALAIAHALGYQTPRRYLVRVEEAV